MRPYVERRRLDTGGPRYPEVATRRTYQRLERTARAVLEAGFPVILDATFLDHQGRARLRALAAECEVDFRILSVHAPPPLLEARVIHRRAAENDPSDATPEVIEMQRAKAEPLTAGERDATLVIDTSREIDIDAVIDELRRGPRHRLGSVSPQRPGKR